jgi:hypothetical protein
MFLVSRLIPLLVSLQTPMQAKVPAMAVLHRHAAAAPRNDSLVDRRSLLEHHGHPPTVYP